MDVITRAELEDSMKNFPTKDALVSAVREAIRENLDDLKIDLSAQLEEKVTKSHNLLGLSAVRTSDLKDAKNEILATMRRNIGEAIEPLKADLGVVKSELGVVKSDVAGLKSDVFGLKSEVAGLKSEMDQRFLKNAARLDAMEHKINTVVMDGFNSLQGTMTSFTAEMREIVKHHEKRLDRYDADFYKLRQSGVLQ